MKKIFVNFHLLLSILSRIQDQSPTNDSFALARHAYRYSFRIMMSIILEIFNLSMLSVRLSNGRRILHFPYFLVISYRLTHVYLENIHVGNALKMHF